MSDLRDLLQEAGRRHVARVAVVYAAVAFALLEAADIIIPALGFAEWTIRWVIALALLGFPVTLILAWVYDVTPQGVIRTRALEEESSGPGESGGQPSVHLCGAPAGKRCSRGLGCLLGLPMVPWRTLERILGLGRDGVWPTWIPRGLRFFPSTIWTNRIGAVFANGIHEDILNHLAKIDSLEVISRTTVEQYGIRKNAPPISGGSSAQDPSWREVSGSKGIHPGGHPAHRRQNGWPPLVCDFRSGNTNVFQVQSEIAQEIARASR